MACLKTSLKGDRMKRRALASIGILALLVLALSLGGCDILAGSSAISWTDDAQSHKGQNNRTFKYTLPPAGTEDSIWGTDIYTDDSSIGTAAVHAGLITFAAGGTVEIRILPGQSSYTGSTRNGVTSGDWDAWDGSFEFVD